MAKKDSLIKGTIILAAAALIARVLGLFQRVPLDYFFGSTAKVAFGTANNIYLALLVIATAGIPSTVSKMVSERMALGKPAEAQRIYRAAQMFGVVAGVLITAVLLVFAPLYASLANQPDSVPAIRALAPALIFFPMIAMMRGYFQGRQMMLAGGISQIVEQILRVLTAVLFAYLLYSAGSSDKIVAAGAAFGGVAGSIGALGVMVYFALRLRKQDRVDGVLEAVANRGGTDISAVADKLRFRSIYGEIFKTSIPIVLISFMVPLIYLIDSLITIPLVKHGMGLEAAEAALGDVFQKAQSLAGIPPILAIALSQSIIPAIASAYAAGRSQEVVRQASQALRISIYSGVPVVIAMVVAARPINNLIFEEPTGIGYIALLTFGTIFQIIMMTSGSILTGLGKQRWSMKHVYIGIAVKLAASFALAPFFNVYGILAATTLCFLVTAGLNLRALRKFVDYNVLGGRWSGFLATIVLASGLGWGLELLTDAFVPGGKIVHNLIACVVVGGAAFAAYAAGLWLFRVVTAEEAAGFPAPLRKLINRVLRLLGKSLPAKREA
ncbi:putative polysaccharide biosynthesis protein [Paenibacillus gansuensis]|uniref:Polysaccharide biosynthesis C-terminal domain-containing protein n=1 Tax=Paenibacillus gansuensis TaxID=306542 RepID=A0ABW5PEW4_9BACL